MTSHAPRFPLRLRPSLLVLAVIAMAFQPASAAETVYPPGSRIGVEPPASLTVSQRFLGFEDAQHKVVMLFAELPPQAYEATLKSLADAAASTGDDATNVKREVLLTRSGAAHVIAGDQKANDIVTRKWILLAVSSNHDFVALVTVIVPKEARSAYPDDKVREILKSVTLRSAIPKEETLALLPFKLTELADFKFLRPVAQGRAVLLTDAPATSDAANNGPQIVVSISRGGPLESDDRARFAERLLTTIPGLKDTRKTFSEPQRIGGSPGYEIRLEGKDSKTDEDVVVVQWVRFGATSFIRLIGMAPKDQWQDAFTRFRGVRDGIEYR